MYCVRTIRDDLYWIGGNDRRLSLFESAHPVPRGVSYNSYLLSDEKTVLLDTVDRSIAGQFFENLAHVLGGRALDYVVIHHMEPDHAATLQDLIMRYPDVTLVCNAKSMTMFGQFFSFVPARVLLVKEGDVLETGRHRLRFFMAPMVHWPEVMVSFDEADGTLFSADAFGSFGAMNGPLFADEVDFAHEGMDEARRYYTNIVGKYGPQVLALLDKTAKLDVRALCPLHGLVWRRDLHQIVDKYRLWASYTPEVQGVLIAFSSVYGGTENAANILACRLAERGIPVMVHDVSIVHASYVLADCFRYSHLVFASTTYNNGVFVSMENLLHDVAAHDLKKRTVAFIQNGSWAPASGKLMAELLSKLKEIRILEGPITLRSALAPGQEGDLAALADALADSVQKGPEEDAQPSGPRKGFVCKICGYVYEGDALPEGFTCPLCRRPASDFQPTVIDG